MTPHSPGIPSLRTLEKATGYIFKDRALAGEALTHRSYFHENSSKTSSYNERLEFLGDSVLGLVVVDYLFHLKQSYSESVLAKIKSYLVSEAVLSEIAGSMSLGAYLLLGKGEEATGGREKKSILANALEALVGAVFLDGGFEKAQDLVLSLIKERIDSAIASGDFYDYKTELQEKTQLQYGILPEYRVVREQGAEHQRVFTVSVYLNGKKLATATGQRKKEAETRAAHKALATMQVSAEAP
ncbi:MAG: ribonuclease III [Thermodesulfovibrionales bacterium]